MRRLLILAAALSLLVPAAPALAQSQATTAEINGIITDAQGGVLPGVTVTVTSPATGYTRSVVTNDAGLYSLPLLQPGAYDLTAELAGFGPVKRSLVLNVGATLTINQTLQVGGVQETVMVEASSPLVETSATVRTTTVDAEAIGNLPINGRRFQDFVTLTPTVQVDPSRGQLSFAGQRGINSNVSVDGADFNQPFFGGIRGGERANNAFTVPQEAIQEFQVIAAGYSAEFGRSTGGLVNAITKSGTNRLRGSVFYVNRNRDWAELNAFGQSAAPTQQQFGGSAGGPIRENRIFFFGAYEQQLFENTRQVLFDRLAGFTPAAASQEAFDFFRGLETPFVATNDALTTLGRLDFQIGDADRLSLRYSYSNNEALNANATGNALDPNTVSALTNNGTEKDNTNIVVGQYTSALGTSLLFEARGQYAREERPREANDPLLPTVESAIGRYGVVSFLPNRQFDWRTQAAANLTWLKGTHSVKVGTEYNHVFADQDFGFNQLGRFLISGSNTATHLDILSVGGSIANRFDSPDVRYLRQLGNLRLAFSTDEIAAFAQDAWKLRPNFTVNYGLRWEGAANPTPEANNDFLVGATRGVTFPVGVTTDPTQIQDQWTQWGPRAGFAWDVASDGRTVVRGYSGLYYARTPALLYAASMNNFRVPAGDLSIQLPLRVAPGNPNTTVYDQLKLIGIDLNDYELGSLPVLTPEQVTEVGEALGLSVNPYFGAQPIVMDQDYRNPRATQAGLGIEREVLEGVSVGAEFTYVQTDFLQRNHEVNLPAPIVRDTDPAQRPFFGITAGASRPVGELGSVQVRESSATSEYKALALTSRVRKPWGQLSVNYVLSKSESDDDNERDSGGQGAVNAFDFGPEYGPARLDRRHQFNGFVLYYLPLDIDVSAGFRFLSGRPVDASVGFDANGDTIGNDRPYSAPGVSFIRNTFRNEPIKEVNLRAQWHFDFSTGQRLLFTVDTFNLFNWDNIELNGSAVTNYCATPVPATCGFGDPMNPNFLSLTDRNPGSTRLGQLLLNNTPGAPRQVQLGVRLQF